VYLEFNHLIKRQNSIHDSVLSKMVYVVESSPRSTFIYTVVNKCLCASIFIYFCLHIYFLIFIFVAHIFEAKI